MRYITIIFILSYSTLASAQENEVKFDKLNAYEFRLDSLKLFNNLTNIIEMT